MDALLQHTAGWPEIALAAGQTLLREGEPGGGLWVLVSGRLQVLKDGVAVNAVDRPGAAIGEVSLLLGAPFSATVVAAVPSVVRHAADGAVVLERHPAVLRLIAAGLAERLHVVTTYLADLKHQYGDAPGLTMVADVLQQLTQRQPAPARPGSRREPDPEY